MGISKFTQLNKVAFISDFGLGKTCSTEIPEFSENDNFNKKSLYGHFKIYPTK